MSKALSVESAFLYAMRAIGMGNGTLYCISILLMAFYLIKKCKGVVP